MYHCEEPAGPPPLFHPTSSRPPFSLGSGGRRPPGRQRGKEARGENTMYPLSPPTPVPSQLDREISSSNMQVHMHRGGSAAAPSRSGIGRTREERKGGVLIRGHCSYCAFLAHPEGTHTHRITYLYTALRVAGRSTKKSGNPGYQGGHNDLVRTGDLRRPCHSPPPRLRRIADWGR